jgi:hypothetical protein
MGACVEVAFPTAAVRLLPMLPATGQEPIPSQHHRDRFQSCKHYPSQPSQHRMHNQACSLSVQTQTSRSAEIQIRHSTPVSTIPATAQTACLLRHCRQLTPSSRAPAALACAQRPCQLQPCYDVLQPSVRESTAAKRVTLSPITNCHANTLTMSTGTQGLSASDGPGA